MLPQSTPAPTVVWGAPAIAATINRPLRATYHMLESGALPGAKKIAGRWCFDHSVFLAKLREN
jgi:hypothetical protein